MSYFGSKSKVTGRTAAEWLVKIRAAYLAGQLDHGVVVGPRVQLLLHLEELPQIVLELAAWQLISVSSLFLDQPAGDV